MSDENWIDYEEESYREADHEHDGSEDWVDHQEQSDYNDMDEEDI